MTTQKQRYEQDRPIFSFYEQFAKDWEKFSHKEKKYIREFLEDLQVNYRDAKSRGWEQREGYWGAPIPEIGFRVIWRVLYPTHLGVEIPSQPAKEIGIDACEPIPPGKRELAD